jgi:hypothetical protein
MFFSSRKKSTRQVRVRYQPQLLELEDRVVPSTTALDALLHPAGHASLIAATSANSAEQPSDPGIGDQVSAKAHELQDARTSEVSQGIGTDLSTFVHTLVPANDEANSGHSSPASDDDTDQSSGDHGIGDQVSAKAHELQDARTSGDSQGIGTDLSTFVHTLNQAGGENEDSRHQSPASGDDTGQSGDQGIGDQVSAKAQALQDARTSGDSQGIGKELSAFVHSLVAATEDDGNSQNSSLIASQTTSVGEPTLPTAAEDRIATASSHNGSSRAAEHSPIFENGSPIGSSVMFPAAAGNGITTAAGANGSPAAAEHSLLFEGGSSADPLWSWPAGIEDGCAKAYSDGAGEFAFFGSNLSEDTPVTLSAANEEEIATAPGENASCQTPDHLAVCESGLVTSGDSLDASE